MKAWTTLAAAVLIAAGLMVPGSALAGPPAPPPPPTVCMAALSGSVSGDVVVPTGTLCEVVDGTTISGNVTVQEGAVLLVVTGPVTIGGNVKGKNCLGITMSGGGPSAFPLNVVIGGELATDGCRVVSYTFALIGKNVTCKNSDYCVLDRSVVGGNLECSGNTSAAGCYIPDSRIGGDAKLNNNAAIHLDSNQVAGNLKCSGNGTVDDLGGNVVAGTASGQCAGF